ncbi:hypothetical protein PFLmoz3_01282 [Pseudomonas fluorescens]|uniref:Uncharacterized protein n=1 Tax=Pseudomonas fluorescens TaxID=294 RepID=A0A109LI76_PSEFL|nr:hypothetical protein PFLmoz3_01282 [Pseudomonas fluorescens]
MRIGGAEQLTLVIPFKLPGFSQVVGVLGYLILRVPAACADPLQTISNARHTARQVIVEPVLVTFVGPVPHHAPFATVHTVPLVVTTQPGGQLMLDHALAAVVGEAALHICVGIANFGQVAASIVAVTDKGFSAVIGV